MQQSYTHAPLVGATGKEWQGYEDERHDVLAESEVSGTRYCLIRYRPASGCSDPMLQSTITAHVPIEHVPIKQSLTNQLPPEPLSLLEHHPLLSPRERAIAKLIAQGLPNKIIGDKLGISPWTVATYIRRIFAKIGVTSRSAMIAALMRGAQSNL